MTDLSSMVLSILDARRGSLTLKRHIVDVPWIRETAPARTVVCPDCDWMHEEEPIARTWAGGEVRLYIPCPEAGRVEIDPSQLRLWLIDLAMLAEEIARLMGMSGRVLELLTDRLWRLGRTRWKQTSRDVLFARGPTLAGCR